MSEAHVSRTRRYRAVKEVPDIPEYIVMVAHPDFGWQVVALAMDINSATQLYDTANQRWTPYNVGVKLLHIIGDQTWAVVYKNNNVAKGEQI